MNSKIYLLTNKVTHARCVVVAPSPDAAKRVHPTGIVGWSESTGRWVKHTGGHFGRMVVVPPPEGWTAKLELLHADELGTPGRMYSGTLSVIAYEPSTQLRHGGVGQPPSAIEGPDDSWGGYTLKDLGS